MPNFGTLKKTCPYTVHFFHLLHIYPITDLNALINNSLKVKKQKHT